MVAFALILLGQPAVELTLSTSKAVVRAGEAIVLKVEATNRSPKPISLVLPRDGMSDGLRAPYIEFQAQGENGEWAKAVPKEPLFRCGNTNGVAPDDFVVVKPSGKRTLLEGPDEDVDGALREPGTYTLRFQYDTRPELERWRGNPGVIFIGHEGDVAPFLRKAYADAPKGLFVSNEVTVRVTPVRP